jgi:hypothetical protein
VGLYKLEGLVPRAAVVALVAAGLLVAAHRARPLDVAVRQKTALRRAVHLLRLRLRDVPAPLEFLVEELGVPGVQPGRGAREVVEADAEALERILHVRPPVVHDLARALPLALGGQGDGDAVLVGAAHVDHVLASGAQVPYVGVRRQVRTHDLPDVQRTVGVGQRRGDQIARALLFHALRIALRLFGWPAGQRIGPALLR